MKRFLALALAMSLAFSVVGCGKKEEESSANAGGGQAISPEDMEYKLQHPDENIVTTTPSEESSEEATTSTTSESSATTTTTTTTTTAVTEVSSSTASNSSNNDSQNQDIPSDRYDDPEHQRREYNEHPPETTTLPPYSPETKENNYSIEFPNGDWFHIENDELVARMKKKTDLENGSVYSISGDGGAEVSFIYSSTGFTDAVNATEQGFSKNPNMQDFRKEEVPEGCYFFGTLNGNKKYIFVTERKDGGSYVIDATVYNLPSYAKDLNYIIAYLLTSGNTTSNGRTREVIQ